MGSLKIFNHCKGGKFISLKELELFYFYDVSIVGQLSRQIFKLI